MCESPALPIIITTLTILSIGILIATVNTRHYLKKAVLKHLTRLDEKGCMYDNMEEITIEKSEHIQELQAQIHKMGKEVSELKAANMAYTEKLNKINRIIT